MAKITPECPVCKRKNVIEKSHFTLGTKRFITLNCNHTYTEDMVGESKEDSIILKDGRNLYPFQVEGVHFIERSNFRAQISDEMGLGKTIQAIGAINLHFEELKPILIVVKASLTYNWFKEILSGTGRISQIFESGDNLIPGVEIVLISFDTLSPRERKNKTTGVTRTDRSNLDKILAYKAKTLIIDECQMMKNHNAKRTQAIRDVVRNKVKVTDKPISELERNSKTRSVEMIASDLMKWHGITPNFKLLIGDMDPNILGMTKCRVEGEGKIVGEIVLSTRHILYDSIDEIIETILHEIAHAITPGAGHVNLWKETSLSIGGNGDRIAYCNGTVNLDEERSSPTVKHIISLSGTPIKNNALEYFPILNLLRPEMFPSQDHFERNYVDYYWSGKGYKAGGLKYPENFLSKTKDFIIRRMRKEVLPDLPLISRDYKYYPMSDKVKQAYGKRVKELSNFLDEERDSNFQIDLLAMLGILRHLTGLAKIEPVLEFTLDFIENDENHPKITIFHHHIDVGDVVEKKLIESGIGIARILSSQDSETRLDKIEEFRSNPAIQVLLVPTLAGGEGINLQFCSHAIIMEREWNPANEEQAEGRFSRIGSTSDKIQVTYPVATGTIDEYFAEIVERKREIVGLSLDGKSDSWDHSSIMLELAEKVVSKWSF